MTRTRRAAVAAMLLALFVAPLAAQTQKARPKTPAPAPKAPPAASAATAAVMRAVTARELEKSLSAVNIDRTSGRDGERKAAAYVEQQLKAWNVKYTRSDPRVWLSWPGKAEVAVLGDTTASMRAVAAAFSAPTPAGGLTAEAVALSGNLDERGTSQDVRGKILLVPAPMTPEAVARAERTPAIGVIFVSDTDALPDGTASSVWGTPTPADRVRLPRVPIVSVSKGSGDRLRHALSRGSVAVKIVAEVQQQWASVPLIVADIPGAQPEFVLVTTHLDAWYEGMTDGGSGVAELLELARVLQPQRAKLRRGIRLAWWPASATGNYAGSAWWADRFAGDIDRYCAAYMNVEGAGRRGSRLDAVEAGGWPAVAEIVRQASRTVTGKTPATPADARLRPERQQDASFQGLGVSEFWIALPGPAKPSGDVDANGRVKYWHTRDDKLDKIDLKVLALDTQYRAGLLYEMATAAAVPLQLGPVVAALTRALDDLGATAAPFDLAGVRAAATALAAAAARLDAQAKPTRPEAIAALNHLLVRISHRLQSALYARAGRFGQDPIAKLPLLPALADAARLPALPADGDERAFLETELLRARNQIESALRDAVDEIQAYLSGRT